LCIFVLVRAHATRAGGGPPVYSCAPPSPHTCTTNFRNTRRRGCAYVNSNGFQLHFRTKTAIHCSRLEHLLPTTPPPHPLRWTEDIIMVIGSAPEPQAQRISPLRNISNSVQTVFSTIPGATAPEHFKLRAVETLR
jgi:hypothetical protein